MCILTTGRECQWQASHQIYLPAFCLQRNLETSEASLTSLMDWTGHHPVWLSSREGLEQDVIGQPLSKESGRLYRSRTSYFLSKLTFQNLELQSAKIPETDLCFSAWKNQMDSPCQMDSKSNPVMENCAFKNPGSVQSRQSNGKKPWKWTP